MKKYLLILMTLFLLAAAPAPAFAASTFPDINGHWAQPHIEHLLGLNLISGFPDGTFKPNQIITRAQVASILANELGLTAQAAAFPDVPASHWANGAVGAIAAHGTMNGYLDGTFKPDQAMNRAEIASVLSSAYGFTQSSATSPFSDVTASHWAFGPIMALVDGYITEGYPDGTFKPNNAMTRAEFSVFMAKAIHPPFVVPTMLQAKALTIAQILKDEDMTQLATHVHPVLGVRFSPYYYIDNTHKVVSAAALPGLLADNTVYFWGIQDGSGFNIDETPQDYFDRYVNARDFTTPDQTVYNTVVSRGNMINNIPNYYTSGIFVELYLNGIDPQYGGMDWRSLYLVFELYNGDYYLVGIANGEWTT
ncbi:S-layer homology domain-containing protein [Acidaminobacter hydrogenoformans]|uniref:S-layer homology domain-containing protein n=1 Tax=Acidaminobacter hydrogenoformans DSM 2784 TaxID=1120920 RepID=A0A1G5S0Y1_9FIRM|nr:S-layer homology domain-containing protein [Acidaminobacter hydrogenoformans]SCZ80024.1 S-layer homology domain-containing protein [Acidaminobacter hydrogenoformans DSM 2784]